MNTTNDPYDDELPLLRLLLVVSHFPTSQLDNDPQARGKLNRVSATLAWKSAQRLGEDSNTTMDDTATVQVDVAGGTSLPATLCQPLPHKHDRCLLAELTILVDGAQRHHTIVAVDAEGVAEQLCDASIKLDCGHIIVVSVNSVPQEMATQSKEVAKLINSEVLLYSHRVAHWDIELHRRNFEQVFENLVQLETLHDQAVGARDKKVQQLEDKISELTQELAFAKSIQRPKSPERSRGASEHAGTSTPPPVRADSSTPPPESGGKRPATASHDPLVSPASRHHQMSTPERGSTATRPETVASRAKDTTTASSARKVYSDSPLRRSSPVHRSPATSRSMRHAQQDVHSRAVIEEKDAEIAVLRGKLSAMNAARVAALQASKAQDRQRLQQVQQAPRQPPSPPRRRPAVGSSPLSGRPLTSPAGSRGPSPTTLQERADRLYKIDQNMHRLQQRRVLLTSRGDNMIVSGDPGARNRSTSRTGSEPASAASSRPSSIARVRSSSTTSQAGSTTSVPRVALDRVNASSVSRTSRGPTPRSSTAQTQGTSLGSGRSGSALNRSTGTSSQASTTAASFYAPAAQHRQSAARRPSPNDVRRLRDTSPSNMMRSSPNRLNNDLYERPSGRLRY